MNIVIERVENPENWDVELDYFRGSLFMTRPWIESVADHERTPLYLRFRNNGEVIGVLGGLEVFVRDRPEKQLLFYSGISSRINEPSVAGDFKNALYDYAKMNGFSRIIMKSYDHHSYVPAGISKFKEFKRTEYVFDLSMEKDLIMKGFKRDVRRKVKKAEESGMVLENSCSPEFVERLFNLLDETLTTRKSKGYGVYDCLYIPLFDQREIENLVRNKGASFYYAGHENEILSIQLIFTHMKKAYGIFFGTSPRGYQLASPSFLFYKVTEELKDKGFLYYNIGGVQRGKAHSGLKRFKDTLGAGLIESAEETTNFLNCPLSCLNPLLNTKRILSGEGKIPWRLRKPVIDLAEKLIGKKDQV